MDPPPPPPHGEAPKSSGLPPGKYDIFIVPPHSSGSGFLYLPSLQPNVNSFAAGFASALIVVAIGSMLAPAFQAWWSSVRGSGGMGMVLLMLAIAVGAWALGRTQKDGGPGPGGGGGGVGGGESGPPPQNNAHSHTHSNGYAGGPTPGPGPTPNTGAAGGGERPNSNWQRPGPSPGGAGTYKASGTAGAAPGGGASTAKGAWERAREETKKREEERKAREAEKKRREEMEKRIRELREREAREREAREREAREREARERERDAREREAREKEARERESREKEAREKEAREKEAREKEARDKEAREREAREKATREREAREKATREREAREKATREREIREKVTREREVREKAVRERLAREREAREALAREREKEAREKEVREKVREKVRESKGGSYAYSAVGEKTNPWPRGKPASPAPRSAASSPTKKPAPQTSKSHLGTEDDAYSYRPYDTPPKKNPSHMKSPSSVYSESSYAASQSTARTTPPPSHRGPRGAYSTKDPDKIVLKAVYSFNNEFIKTPSSQLVSGVGTVTDGLILRITTEGLFIDDDVRGVPQREWDVKAWTMKLVEVWCPSFCQGPAGQSASARVAFNSSKNNPVRRLWGLDKEKPATSEETDALLVDMLQSCRDHCCHLSPRSAAASSAASSFDDASDSAYGSSVGSPSPRNHRTNGVFSQTGDLKSAGLHVLRASIRDQNGKKYLFVIADEESWKIALGLQRLRKGSQVRALGVSGMSTSDARGTLENLGWV